MLLEPRVGHLDRAARRGADLPRQLGELVADRRPSEAPWAGGPIARRPGRSDSRPGRRRSAPRSSGRARSRRRATEGSRSAAGARCARAAPRPPPAGRGCPRRHRGRVADEHDRRRPLRARLGSRRTTVARPSSGRAAQTIASDPSTATLAQNSVRVGAISSVASRRDRGGVRHPGLASGRDRLRVGDHEEQEDEDLRRGDEHPPEVGARDRADVPARGHRVTRQREHADRRRRT